jgi:hypothetical protein
MSILALPRLHFRGTFSTNVDTANNDDIVRVVDDVAVQVETGGMSDDEFIRWMEETITVGSPPREVIRASWNYYGTNGCGFEQCAITSVDRSDGQRVTAPGEEPLIGASVFLGLPEQRNTGLMVDLDPEGIIATQIFADAVRITGPAGQLLRGTPTVAHSRWLSFERNLGLPGFGGASAVWQMALPADSLQFAQNVSPTLDALRELAQQRRGLVMRFCTYALSPRISQSELAERFRNGQKDQNPAIGRVVGTIGVWDGEELASASAGRRLYPAGSVSFDHLPVRLGPGAAHVDMERNVVTLDLVTAFPELDGTLEKVDFGPVTLAAVAADGAVTPLGQVAYDRSTYEEGAGVVEIPIPDSAGAAVAASALQLIHDASGMPLMEEPPLTIETDDRNLYLQLGETRQATLRFSRRGAAPGERLVAVTLQYVTSNKAQPAQPSPPERHLVAMPERVECDESGRAGIELRAIAPGTCAIAFQREGEPAGALDATLGAFLNVRVFPADDYSTIPDSELTFDLIYREVLRYYHLIYPAMSRIFPLNGEEAVRENAEAILERIDPAVWGKWEYMPRTRELSEGKRQLLERWCRLQL